MSVDIYKINPEFRDIMPKEILDLEDNATWQSQVMISVVLMTLQIKKRF